MKKRNKYCRVNVLEAHFTSSIALRTTEGVKWGKFEMSIHSEKGVCPSASREGEQREYSTSLPMGEVEL
jgi:hypothetical protein